MMIRQQERRKGGFECFALQWTPLFIVGGGGGGGVWTKTTMDEDEREVYKGGRSSQSTGTTATWNFCQELVVLLCETFT
eukprot:scaffold779_cov205-Alexandrium_tamarense.AAC.2